MRSILKALRLSLVLVVLSVQISCADVFHNGKLDGFWRLDNIEFVCGEDFDGNWCAGKEYGNVFWGFARNVVELNGASLWGKTCFSGDSICIDFSMNPISETDAVLRRYGLRKNVSEFEVECLDGRKMVISDGCDRLSFSRW